MALVYWVRHGENVANLSRTFSYRVFDGDLTERGRQQANRLADSLLTADITFDSVSCSPLLRARQTADILCRRLGSTVSAEFQQLREVNVGELDGRNDREAWKTYKRVIAAWQQGQLGARFPRGESGHELVDRITSTLSAITESRRKGPALVVAHGASIRAAIPYITGQPDPGVDLGTATAACLEVTPSASQPFRLLDWPQSKTASASAAIRAVE